MLPDSRGVRAKRPTLDTSTDGWELVLIVIGLTGGIACGKSTVAEIIRKQGIPVIDADIVAREIVTVGSPAHTAIAKRFGEGVLQPDGSLDRKALAGMVMGESAEHRANRRDLEAITHPQIGARISDTIKQFRDCGHPVVVIEAALMIESGSYKKYDAVMVISCDISLQYHRLMQRDGFDEEIAKRWIDSQLPIGEKVAVADAVVENNGSLLELKRDVEAALSTLIPGIDGND